MDNEKWAQPGDQAFQKGALPADMIWVEMIGVDQGYIDGFYTAAITLIDRLAGERSDIAPYELVFPIIFLYRQYLELQLKAIVRLGVQMNVIPDPGEALTRHSLSNLWKEVVRLYAAMDVAPMAPDLTACGAVVDEFHVLDKTGQESRYDTTTKNQKTLQAMLPRFSLVGLKNTMEGIYNSLNTYTMDLRALWDGQQ